MCADCISMASVPLGVTRPSGAFGDRTQCGLDPHCFSPKRFLKANSYCVNYERVTGMSVPISQCLDVVFCFY